MTDVWPCLWGKNNAGVSDFVIANFWDVGAAAFQNTQVLTDALKAQWTPQRSGIGFRTNGKWGFGIIEVTSNDLEYWENADVAWDADGAWALTDDDASQNWEAVDIETRQNFIWASALDPTPSLVSLFLNLGTGAPIWTILGGATIGNPILQFSLTIDRNLYGVNHLAYIDVAGNLMYEYSNPPGGPGTVPITIILLIDAPTYPQIVVDGEERLWIFYTAGNNLMVQTAANIPEIDNWVNEIPGSLYSATTLTRDFMIAHNPVDDTIHVVLCDVNLIGDSYLIYIRRTPNGWSDPVTLKSMDSGAGDHPVPIWPQITLDSFNNICIKYIYDETGIGGVGDLRQFLLTTDKYSAFDTPGIWTETSDVDGSEDDVLWVVAPTNMPEWIPTSGMADEFLLLESGDFILLESGDKIIL